MHFDFIPAIDLLDGKVVRLHQGNYDQVTEYGSNPISIAESFYEAGARWLHVVDLNAARSGLPLHEDIIAQIIDAVPINVEIGGGVRSTETAYNYLDAGAMRVIIGSAAIENPEVLDELLQTKADRIAVGIDARSGKIATRGWEATTELDALDYAAQLFGKGVRTFVFTDIAKDGTLQGPNLVALKNFAESVPAKVIASGGIGSLADVKSVYDLSKKYSNIIGVIAGRAIYDGKFRVAEAVASIETFRAA